MRDREGLLMWMITGLAALTFLAGVAGFVRLMFNMVNDMGPFDDR